MSLKLIQQSVIPLFLATFFIGLFYLQFIYFYPFIIENFRESPLFLLYAHLFIYLFLVQVLFTTLVNLLNNFIIKSKVFVAVSLLLLLIFYLLTFSNTKDILTYFLDYSFSDNAIMGIILFMVTTFGYTLYSTIVLFFNRFIPLSHLLIFLIITLFYAGAFIDSYCYPIEELFHKLKEVI